MRRRVTLVLAAGLASVCAACGAVDRQPAPPPAAPPAWLPAERSWPLAVRWVDCGAGGSCALAVSVGGAVLDVSCRRIRPELVDARVVGRRGGLEVRLVSGVEPAAFLAVRPGRPVCDRAAGDDWLLLLPAGQSFDGAGARAAYCRAALLTEEQRRVDGCPDQGAAVPSPVGPTLAPLDPAVQAAVGCVASGADFPTGARGPVPEVDYAEPPPRTLRELAAASDLVVLARVAAGSSATDVELVGVEALRGEAGATLRVAWFQPEGLPRPVPGYRYVLFLRRAEGGVAVPALGSLGLYLADGTCVRRLTPAGPGPDPIPYPEAVELVADAAR